MKIALLQLAVLSACANAGRAGGSDNEDIVAIVDVAVLAMDAERILPRQTVIMRDEVIVEIGPVGDVPVPADAQRIDGTGRFLIPGLIDAHVHLRDPEELLSYLAYGVTTVVHLSGPLGRVQDVMQLRDQVARGAILGPAIYTSGRLLDGDPPVFPNVSTVVRTPEDARAVVEEQFAAGADLIKVYNNLRGDELRAVTRAAHELGLTVWGHVPRAEGRATALQQSLADGLDVIAHGEEIFFTLLHRDVESQLDRGLVPEADEELMAEAIRLVKDHGATVVPNLSFVAMTRHQLDDVQRVWSHPEARFLHPAVLDMWRQQNPTTRDDLARFDLRERGKQAAVRELTRRMNAAGIPLLLGTDASAPGMFPGYSAHVELSELVAAGLTPYQALSIATRQPGEFLHRHVRGSPRVGTVTPGSRADLVLLEADPWTDIANVSRIVGVVVRGRWYARSEIDSLRESRHAADDAR